MEKIVLIGASGFVGSAILDEALRRAHPVVAVVREPARIVQDSPLLRVAEADVAQPGEIERVCGGFDTVVSAYNPGWENPRIAQCIAEVYPLIIEGLKRAGVKRVLIVGGAGSLFVAPGLRLVDSGRMNARLVPGARALADFYRDVLRPEHGIDWGFFAPADELVHGRRTGKFRLGKDDLVTDPAGRSRISVEDYALAMIDEVELPAHHYERFTIGYTSPAER